MVLNQKLTLGFTIFVFGLLSSGHIDASPLSETYTGALTNESGAAGSVVLESFSLTSTSEVTIYTTSYGGGMNLNGSRTPAGGFQPNITLYNGAGVAVANQSASFSPIGKTDPTTGLELDGYLQDTDAAAGKYYVTLTDWQNQMSATSTGLNLAEAAYLQFSGPGGTSFQDVGGNDRTGNYALDISAMSNTSSTPEPSTFLLSLPFLAVAALIKKKRRSQAS